ncbi:VWA domain-containing protein [Actinomadura craniellae]|uniref:VWA domain-containing protein n=2 Tax=Actinomadura craniellae TaxID=2231787 RepID=A0A365GY39_9ACTN|nr:VWA domain-containing protein [Actinomadura craniellae]
MYPGGMPPVPPRRRRSRAGAFVAVAVLVAVGLVAALVVVVVLAGGGGCGSAGTTLTMVSSPEKYGLVAAAAKEYSGREVAGECVEVKVWNKSSGEAMAALARGWNPQVDGSPRPDVWSPASSGWVALLRQRLDQRGLPDFVPRETPGIAVSPLVIAMPRPMAQALGWPGKELGWDDILRLSRDPRGWAAHGHPEWGAFKLGKTDPNFSTSGLNATVGAYFAATGKSADLSAADLDRGDVQSYVRGVEGAVVHYGDTTLTFLEGLRRADATGGGLKYVSAVAVEEASVWYYNQGNPTGDPKLAGRNPKPRTPLVAIYPKEGTLVSDHPYVTLTGGDSRRQRLATDFLNHLRGTETQAAFGREAFRSYDNRAGMRTTQANGLLPDQPRKMIAPPAPEVLDRMLRSWELLRKRANVLFVVDVSGSMNEPAGGTGRTRMALAKQSLVKAADRFVGVDRVGLWEFSTGLSGRIDYRPVVPVGTMTDAHRGLLKSRINGLTPRGDTGLYDTVAAAFAHVRGQRQGDAINSVVVLTDGKNDDSTRGLSLDQLLGRLDRASGVRVFTIAYGTGADQGALRRISEATDATAYNSSDPATLDRVLSNVTSNF